MDATLPTVFTESVMISAAIDAYREWDVAVVDITGANLSADMDDDVFMILRGTMEGLMVVANPKIYLK